MSIRTENATRSAVVCVVAGLAVVSGVSEAAAMNVAAGAGGSTAFCRWNGPVSITPGLMLTEARKADLVTEMALVKHHFAAGVKAQAGIEF